MNLTADQLARLTKDEVYELLYEQAEGLYDSREEMFGSDIMRQLERVVMLQVVDHKWMDHLDAMDMLREGIGLRAYGQKDPLVEYKHEGFEMFTM